MYYDQEIKDWFGRIVFKADILYFKKCFRRQKICLIFEIDEKNNAYALQYDMFRWCPMYITRDEALDIIIDFDKSLGDGDYGYSNI